METVGVHAGFLLARIRAAGSGQTSVDQGHGWRGQAEHNKSRSLPTGQPISALVSGASSLRPRTVRFRSG